MPSVADIIEREKSHLIERWIEGAGRAASARGLDRPQLTNLIPEYLSALGRSITFEPTGEEIALIENHLSHRLRQGFDVGEVLVEFSILARIIGEMLDALTQADRPPADGIDRLFRGLHRATMTVTNVYSQHLIEDEQVEKRYARLIQNVVSEAAHVGNGGYLPLKDLGRIVGLVREALGADTAALMLYDAGSECLTEVALDGLGDGAGVPYVTALGPASFAGPVGGGPVAGSDLHTRTFALELSPFVLERGGRSLLGGRLYTDRELIGVLYVGAYELRDFTASDVRRLDSLGDRIALHLQNARLSARVREKLDQLQLFVDILAHDLRGPLTAALVAINLLREASGNGNGRATKMATIERSLRRIDRMVTDLLDAHGIAAGEPLRLHVSDDSLETLVADAIGEASARAPARVRLQVSGQLHGRFDPGLVRRAVWNMIVNALKYGDADAPVTVTAHGDGRGFLLEVHNHGVAIAAEEQARLFKPFTRSRPAAGAHKSGWGLGLALVAGCATAHGGTVGVDSATGRGTTFRLYIPWQPALSEWTDDAR